LLENFLAIEKVIDFVNLYRQLNIASGQAKLLLTRNVRLMFFNQHPERFFPYIQIDIVYLPDGPGGGREVKFLSKLLAGHLCDAGSRGQPERSAQS
jgi:hypothetical protein